MVPISPSQCRAARGLLNWTQGKLSEVSQISRPTIIGFETNGHTPTRSNVQAIEAALRSGGADFGQNGEVRFAAEEVSK